MLRHMVLIWQRLQVDAVQGATGHPRVTDVPAASAPVVPAVAGHLARGQGLATPHGRRTRQLTDADAGLRAKSRRVGTEVVPNGVGGLEPRARGFHDGRPVAPQGLRQAVRREMCVVHQRLQRRRGPPLARTRTGRHQRRRPPPRERRRWRRHPVRRAAAGAANGVGAAAGAAVGAAAGVAFFVAKLLLGALNPRPLAGEVLLPDLARLVLEFLLLLLTPLLLSHEHPVSVAHLPVVVAAAPRHGCTAADTKRGLRQVRQRWRQLPTPARHIAGPRLLSAIAAAAVVVVVVVDIAIAAVAHATHSRSDRVFKVRIQHISRLLQPLQNLLLTPLAPLGPLHVLRQQRLALVPRPGMGAVAGAAAAAVARGATRGQRSLAAIFQAQGPKLRGEGLLGPCLGLLRLGGLRGSPHRIGNLLPHPLTLQNVLQLRPLFGRRVQHPLDQLLGVLAACRGDRRVSPPQDLERQAVDALRLEGVRAVDELVEDAAEAPDVALVSVRLTVEDLWRHGEGSADLRGGELRTGVQHTGDAQIAKFEGEALVLLAHLTREKHILRLQVSVQNSPGMEGLKCERDLHEPLQNLPLSWKGLAVALSTLEVAVHIAMLAVLHEDAKMPSLVYIRVPVRDDVRVQHLPEQMHLQLRGLPLLLLHAREGRDLLHDILLPLVPVHHYEHLAEGTASNPANEVILGLPAATVASRAWRWH
mmetsp:Transcript_106628/g.340236  ORF Transcript_106628/g.340236 Transcript_106628/m.340236 type:complete len:701 (+) Transcript_106628:784-2886(+)